MALLLRETTKYAAMLRLQPVGVGLACLCIVLLASCGGTPCKQERVERGLRITEGPFLNDRAERAWGAISSPLLDSCEACIEGPDGVLVDNLDCVPDPSLGPFAYAAPMPRAAAVGALVPVIYRPLPIQADFPFADELVLRADAGGGIFGASPANVYRTPSELCTDGRSTPDQWPKSAAVTAGGEFGARRFSRTLHFIVPDPTMNQITFHVEGNLSEPECSVQDAECYDGRIGQSFAPVTWPIRPVSRVTLDAQSITFPMTGEANYPFGSQPYVYYYDYTDVGVRDSDRPLVLDEGWDANSETGLYWTGPEVPLVRVALPETGPVDRGLLDDGVVVGRFVRFIPRPWDADGNRLLGILDHYVTWEPADALEPFMAGLSSCWRVDCSTVGPDCGHTPDLLSILRVVDRPALTDITVTAHDVSTGATLASLTLKAK
jgi:hypothetical protein